jgi:hypothetical protein
VLLLALLQLLMHMQLRLGHQALLLLLVRLLRVLLLHRA